MIRRVVRRRDCSFYEIIWPSNDEFLEMLGLLQLSRRYGGVLKGVFGVTDGVRLHCTKYSDKTLQNALWEGHTQSNEATYLFIYNLWVELMHAAVSFPLVGTRAEWQRLLNLTIRIWPHKTTRVCATRG